MNIDIHVCTFIMLIVVYLFLSNPKHQSGENFVCPVTIKESVMFLCKPVSTRHSRYPTIACIVLILTPTVVRVEVDVLLAEPMYPKEMMEHADDGIGSLPGVSGLVNQVINLTWDSLTAHSIDGTLSWGKEVHGARLEGVIRVEYLLGHVEGIVHIDGN